MAEGDPERHRLARVEVPTGQRDIDQPQQAATVGTAQARHTGRRLLRLRQEHKQLAIGQPDQPAHGLNRGPTLGAEESVVPDFLKAVREHVLQEATDEFHRLQRHLPPTVAAALAIGECDALVIEGDEATR